MPRLRGRVAALIVAAGRGMRAGGGLPKQYRHVDGEAVLTRSVRAFRTHPDIIDLRVVIHPDDRALYDAAVAGFGLSEPVHGGATRQESVRAGLEALSALPTPPDSVLIHDAARCFVPTEVISQVIAAIDAGGAVGAIPGLPVADTLKRASNGAIAATVDRSDLYRAQTPQGFPFTAILDAHRAAAGQSLTDDAAVAEAAGMTVRIVEGAESNIKLTRPEDFAMQTDRAMEPRIGSGFDVHRFEPGDHVWLCGVRIAHDRGLKGHSDADAGLHALTDAILGALADGDIGTHFPPSDPRWKGAASDAFLRHAADLATARGGCILHCDITLICERPKIGPHKPAMRARIADILAIAESRVSIKATTTEKLGFTGRGEGLAAEAVATLLLPADG